MDDKDYIMIELAVDLHKVLSERHGSLKASVMMMTGLSSAEIDALGGVREDS